ncbi:MAG: diacylglycerol kinase family protein [Nitriliruptorales bacterium]|nr:diacylglycerol kinase family protein [Nitriliruptorales bacterium]
MEFVVVVNANAGKAEHEAVGTATAVLSEHGDAEVAETEDPSELEQVVRDLDGRQLVVCGGDGSIHLAVDRLRAEGLLEDVTLGWVPLGTGNDLARTLGIPLEPEDAAGVIIDGRRRQLDLVVSDDDTIAVNALHAGVGVDAASRAEELKDRVGEFAYPLGAIAAGVTADGWNLHVEVDGTPVRTERTSNVLLVAVMNGRTFGGGTVMSPDAEPDDGTLDVVVCTPLGPPQRAALGVALQSGTHLDRDDVHLARGEEVVITGDEVGYNIDGELAGEQYTERVFRVEPDRWSILVP